MFAENFAGMFGLIAVAATEAVLYVAMIMPVG